MYNKEIFRRVAGAKNIYTLLYTFRSAQTNLLKLKKYKGLMADDYNGYTIHTVSQITKKGLDATNPDGASMQTDGDGQQYSPLTNNHTGQFSNQHQQTQMYRNPYQQLQPHFAPCYTWVVYGHLSKNWPQQTLAQQNVPNYIRSTPPVATPPYVNKPNTPPSIFSQAFLPNSA